MKPLRTSEIMNRYSKNKIRTERIIDACIGMLDENTLTHDEFASLLEEMKDQLNDQEVNVVGNV